MRTLPRSLVVLITLALLPAGAKAQDWPVDRGRSHEPEPYRYDSAYFKQAPRAFLEDTAACIVYSGTSYLVEPDGTIEAITHEVTRLNGRKGVENLGEYSSIVWDPAYQTLTLNEARVHKADGRIVPIEPRHLQVRDVNVEAGVYASEKALIVSFPSLEVGDVFDVKWSVRGKNPEFGEHFFTRYNFGDERYPVLRDELRVRIPRATTLRYASVNGKVEPEVRDLGRDRLYVWRVCNRPELPQDNDLPSREEFRLELVCSTFPSWEAVGQWKRKLRSSCWTCTPALRDVVREVTAGLHSPADKARALTGWVRRRIRYVSFASARHGYTPHEPAQVLENLFGDCKDQAQLLAVLLREAGVPTSLVTLGARDDGQVVPEVPCPWGTHAILLVRLDGKEHWIDTTAPLAAWDFLPRSDRDRVAYVTDDKTVRVVRTPELNSGDLRYEQSTTVWLGPDGTATCRRTLAYKGLAALVQREAWADVPPGERRRLMAAELQDANSRARLRSLHVEEPGLHDLEAPVRAAVDFDLPGQLNTDGEGSFSDSRIWSRLLAYNLDYDRKVPLDLWAPFESVHRYIIHLAPGYRFETLPKNKLVSSPLASFALRVRSDPRHPRRLDLEFTTRLLKARIDLTDFDEYRRLHHELNQCWRAWVTVMPSGEPTAALALEALLAGAPADLSAAVSLARLYQAQHRPADARRVALQALVFHPTEVGLWELAVASARGPAEQEKVYRELMRRFPQEPKYALAVGRICVTRDQHQAAEKILEPLLRHAPSAIRARAHYELARSDLARKQFTAALAHLGAAYKDDAALATDLDVLLLEGRAHEQLHQPAEAIRVYRQALLAKPGLPEVLATLVSLELAAGQKIEALDHLRQLTLAVGQDRTGLVRAAGLHLDMGRFDDALDLAARAGAAGSDPQAERVLGLVYLRRGDDARAVVHLARAPADVLTQTGLLEAHVRLGNLGRALLLVRPALAVGQQSPRLRQAVATVRRLGERKLAILKGLTEVRGATIAAYDAAVDALVCAEHAQELGRPAGDIEALLGRAFRPGVQLGAAHGLRSLLALEHGRLTSALADAEQAVRLAPQEARGYYVRGRVRLERGQEGDLADLSRTAQLTGRRDAQTLHWLAAALAREGRPAEALATQREAVRLCPHDRELLAQLELLKRAASAQRGG